MKYRHLSRDSAHRKALLRNLVTSLIQHESITTTWHKAKEAQRLAEKLITLAKRDTVASQNKAKAILFVSQSPFQLLCQTHEIRSNHTFISPNSSVICGNATPIVLVATLVSCALSRQRKIKPSLPYWNSWTGPKTCGWRLRRARLPGYGIRPRRGNKRW